MLRAHRVTHLPRDPGRSDVEVFLDTPSWTLVLGETRGLGLNDGLEYMASIAPLVGL